MAFYLFNFAAAQSSELQPLEQQAADLLRSGVWNVTSDTPQQGAFSPGATERPPMPGDLALVYVAAPARVFVGCAEIVSAVQVLTSTGALPHEDSDRIG